MTKTDNFKVTVTTTDGDISIEMCLKKLKDLTKCPTGKVIFITLPSGDEYKGYFIGSHEDKIMLRSLISEATISIPKQFVVYYFQQV